MKIEYFPDGDEGRPLVLMSGNDPSQVPSFISSDGLNFAQEAVTIPASVGTLVDDPEPIRLSDGTFVDITEVVPYL